MTHGLPGRTHFREVASWDPRYHIQHLSRRLSG